MLDDTMGPAVFVMTEGRLYTATITMTVNFLAPAKPGPITGEATVTQLGKTIAFVEGRLTAEDGTLLATATHQRAAGRDRQGDSVVNPVARMKRSAIRDHRQRRSPDFAEPVIGRAFARPVGFIRATKLASGASARAARSAAWR